MPIRPSDAEVKERLREGLAGTMPEPRLALPPGSKKLEVKGSPTSLKAAIDRVCDELFNGCVRATSQAGWAGGEGTLVFRDGRPCLAAYESQARSIYGPRSVVDIARLAESPMSTVTAVEFHPGAAVLLEDLMDRVPSAVVYARDLEALGLWPPSALCAIGPGSQTDAPRRGAAPGPPQSARGRSPPPRPYAASPRGPQAPPAAAPGSKEALRAEIGRMKGFVEALPMGVPPSLRLYDDWTIAERVVKGEKRTAPDGTPLVLIMGEWYVNTPGDRKRFLNPWKA